MLLCILHETFVDAFESINKLLLPFYHEYIRIEPLRLVWSQFGKNGGGACARVLRPASGMHSALSEVVESMSKSEIVPVCRQ